MSLQAASCMMYIVAEENMGKLTLTVKLRVYACLYACQLVNINIFFSYSYISAASCHFVMVILKIYHNISIMFTHLCYKPLIGYNEDVFTMY